VTRKRGSQGPRREDIIRKKIKWITKGISQWCSTCLTSAIETSFKEDSVILRSYLKTKETVTITLNTGQPRSMNTKCLLNKT
jgi:hypothetical protein